MKRETDAVLTKLIIEREKDNDLIIKTRKKEKRIKLTPVEWKSKKKEKL